MSQARYPRSWRVRAANTRQATIAPPEARPWYRIRNAAEPEATIYLFDEVGYWGVTASDFARDLEQITASRISLPLNSPGGEVSDGIAIYEALRRHPATVTTCVDSLAASIASVIAMAGDRVIIAEPAQMMIHQAHGVVVGNTDDMTEQAAVLARIDGTLSEIYAKKAGGTPAQWRKAMKTETWYTATQALAAGLADEIGDVSAPSVDSDDGLDVAAQIRRGLAAAVESLPCLRPAAAAGITTPEQAGQVADALRNALGDPDLEWVNGLAYPSQEAVAFGDLPKWQKDKLVKEGWLSRPPRGLR
jgi:ATP-dependent protease ClpP protease subunit